MASRSMVSFHSVPVVSSLRSRAETVPGQKETVIRLLILTAFVFSCVGTKASCLAAPDYTQSILNSVYPAGGQQGTTVVVRFTGTNGGLAEADSIVIDGKAGVTATDVTPVGKDQIQATLTISKDAVPGRRMVRLKGGVNGLTNFKWFFVTPLAEHTETSKNDTPDRAENVVQPLIVNGRIDPLLDRDCFRFKAAKGQNLVVAIMSHWMDALGYGRTNAGFSDTSLELLDGSGRVLAEAGDTLGYDPLIEYVVPDDGSYVVRVSGMGFKGHPEMVYRLTIGELPYPTAVFPPGGTRGKSIDVSLTGPNCGSGIRRSVVVDDAAFPVQYLSVDGLYAGVFELPFIRRICRNDQSMSLWRTGKPCRSNCQSALTAESIVLVTKTGFRYRWIRASQ